MSEKNLLPASIRSGANFNAYPQYSRIEDLLPRWKTSAQWLQGDYWCNAYYTNIKIRLRTHKIYKQNLPPHSYYVTIQIH